MNEDKNKNKNVIFFQYSDAITTKKRNLTIQII